MTVTDGRLDIVIVNYETPELVEQCLGSIEALAPRAVREVIVVDNSATAEAAGSVVARHPMARLVRPGTNLGYGAGANLGVSAGSAEYVLVLNADTRLHGGAVEALIEDLDGHPEAGVAGPRLVDDRGAAQPSCSHFPTAGRMVLHETGLWKLLRSTRFGGRSAPFFEPAAAAPVPCVLGAALCIRRHDFDRVEGFDPGYFMYYEEVDLCRRLLNLGVVTRFVPSAMVGHIGAASTTAHHVAMQREMLRSLARYTRQHRHDPALMRLRAAAVVSAMAWLTRGLLDRRGRSSIALFRSVIGDAFAGWTRR